MLGNFSPSLGGVADARTRGKPFLGPFMVAIGFLCFNFAICLNNGVYGTLVGPLQHRFHTSRAVASLGLSVTMMMVCALSPVVGQLLRQFPLKRVMICGALLNALGYVVLSTASSIWMVMGTYALIIGPGICLLGTIPSSTLVSNWYVEGRGRALGLINIQLLVFVTPPLVALVLSHHSLSTLFLIVAGVYACLIPVLLLVVARPEHVGQMAQGAATARSEAPGADDGLSVREVLAKPRFWLLTFSIGFLCVGPTVIATHIVPIAVGLGFTLQKGANLLAVFGISSVIGTPIFGWLTDRIGPDRTIALSTGLQLVPWALLMLQIPNYGLLFAVTAALGLSSGCVLVLHSASMGRLFERATYSRAMGLSYFMKIPFIFLPAPVAGYIFDVTGSYALAIAGILGIVTSVCVVFLAVSWSTRRSGVALATS